MIRYFLYARKSSDSEDRQVLSIEAQLQELRDFAERNNLEIVKEFTESMSAKKPGRPVFNEMLLELEMGKADGIIAWHPDRIARNTYDGGRVTYLVDLGVVKDLKFPNFYFDKTANGKFNLSIAFSQAQYFVDGLRENVNRGIRQKIRRGEYPGRAPYGYINHYKTRTIEPDPETFDLFRQLLIKFANGDISQKGFRELLFHAGITGKTDKPVAYGSIYHILQNPFYYGVFKHRGELYPGTHKAMISKETHDMIQERLKLNPKKVNFRKTRKETKIEFMFPGLAECGECGYAVTFEHHISPNKIFKYYRCTGKSRTHKCSQRKYLKEDELAEQVKNLVSQIAIPDDVYEKLKFKSFEWAQSDNTKSKERVREMNQEIETLKSKLTSLLDLQLDGEISLDEYKSVKNIIIAKEQKIKDKIGNLGKTTKSELLEPELAFLHQCNQAFHIVKNNDFYGMNHVIQKVGSKRKVINRKLQIQFLEPFNFLSEFLSVSGNSISRKTSTLSNHCQTQPQSRGRLAQQDSPAVSDCQVPIF